MQLDLSASAQEDVPGVSISDFAKRWEEDPRRAEALRRARQRIAQSVDLPANQSLAKLRLQRGLSQTQLAELIGWRQPYVARIEKGQEDLKFSTMEKLANALNISVGDVALCVQNSRGQT